MIRRLVSALILLLSVALVTEAHTPFYGQRASLFEILPVDSTNIVFMGNSLTNGCEWHELLGNPRVINRGITGDIVQGVDERLAPVTAGKPAKIFLMIGTNDISHDLSADSIAGAITTLVDRIMAETPETKLYLQSVLPFNQLFGNYKALNGKEQIARDINAILRPMAAERGITFIDLYPLFADEEGNLRADLTNDGLHLLGKGYLIWRDAVLPYVNE